MAIEVQSFQVTLTPGSSPATPQTVNIGFPPREVERIEIIVPPGPRGVMGFQLAMSGAQVLPITDGAYIVTDDEKITWDLAGQNNSGAWQVKGYNTGAFSHTIEVRFLTDLPGSEPPPGMMNPLPASTLSG